MLLAFAVVFLVITFLFSLPGLFFSSNVQTFSTLKDTFGALNWLLVVFSAGLGLFIVSSHLHARSLKMVFTKPCPPTVWLASAFLAAVLASLMINSVIWMTAVTASLIFHLHVVAGLLYMSLETFAASVGMIAYLMFLATVIHPVIAAVFVLIFNSTTFYDLLMWTEGAIQGGSKSVALRILKDIFYFFYMVLPMSHPFAKHSDPIRASLRVGPAEWPYVLYSLGYALALSALCYCLSLFFLQKKRLI